MDRISGPWREGECPCQIVRRNIRIKEEAAEEEEEEEEEEVDPLGSATVVGETLSDTSLLFSFNFFTIPLLMTHEYLPMVDYLPILPMPILPILPI